MEAHEVSPGARDPISARRVFGRPYEHKGVVVIPVATVGGGGGSRGKRRGLGMRGQPVGAFVIAGEKVRWKPVVDVNGLLFRAQLLAAAAAMLVLMRR